MKHAGADGEPGRITRRGEVNSRRVTVIPGQFGMRLVLAVFLLS
ncbi:hypothetical protein [Bradyrhizobium sp. HKCCYLR20261]